MTALQRLLEVSQPLASDAARLEVPAPLASLYAPEHLGRIAFAQSLVVLAPRTDSAMLSLEEWNGDEARSWRCEYAGLTSESTVFALDLFGGMHAVRGDGFVVVEPESGAVRRMGSDLEEWASTLLGDWDYETGCSLGAEWQRVHRTLGLRERLLPRQPFVIGGEYETGNLVPVDGAVGARMYATLAAEIRDLRDGVRVQVSWRAAERRC